MPLAVVTYQFQYPLPRPTTSLSYIDLLKNEVRKVSLFFIARKHPTPFQAPVTFASYSPTQILSLLRLMEL